VSGEVFLGQTVLSRGGAYSYVPVPGRVCDLVGLWLDLDRGMVDIDNVSVRFADRRPGRDNEVIPVRQRLHEGRASRVYVDFRGFQGRCVTDLAVSGVAAGPALIRIYGVRR
jgi:hypothetical protein